MKISYVTTYDASDSQAWSGLGKSIAESLQSAGGQLEFIGNLKEPNYYLHRAKRLFFRHVFKKTFQCDRIPSVATAYARQVDSKLALSDCDAVLCPGTTPIARLSTKKPVAFWTDATFAGMIGFYPEWTNLCRETLRDGMRIEQEALSRCRLAIYSSDWAAKTALDHYDVDPTKVHVVPFGANIICLRTEDDIVRIIEQKTFEHCNLLFIGVDWERKGGDLAVAVAGLLNQSGLKTTLHVIGCTPPSNSPDYVKAYGFVSKKTEEGRALIDRLYTQSHFCILPSQAECCAVVLAEASSFGLPSLATNVGGIPTAILDEVNGMTFPLDSNPQDWCDYVLQQLSSKANYARLACSSFQRYTEVLNWDVAGKAVMELMKNHCA